MVGFQTMVIMDLWGMFYHPVVVRARTFVLLLDLISAYCVVPAFIKYQVNKHLPAESTYQFARFEFFLALWTFFQFGIDVEWCFTSGANPNWLPSAYLVKHWPMKFASSTITVEKVLFAQGVFTLLFGTNLVKKAIIVGDFVPLANGACGTNYACRSHVIPKNWRCNIHILEE